MSFFAITGIKSHQNKYMPVPDRLIHAQPLITNKHKSTNTTQNTNKTQVNGDG